MFFSNLEKKKLLFCWVFFLYLEYNTIFNGWKHLKNMWEKELKISKYQKASTAVANNLKPSRSAVKFSKHDESKPICIKTEWPSELKILGVLIYHWIHCKGRDWYRSTNARLESVIKCRHGCAVDCQTLCVCIMFGCIYTGCYLVCSALACTQPAMMEGQNGGMEVRECLPSERGAQSGLLLTQGDSKCTWMNTNDRPDKEERLRRSG